jgi:homoserine kinase type II
MSVYTSVTRSQLDDFFSHYSLGEVISYEGIKEGMVNTNYFITTTHGEFVLTLFEDMTAEEVEPVITLLAHLTDNNISCPNPQHNKQGQPLRQLNQKAAMICNRLAGTAIKVPTIVQCTQIGFELAKLHGCTQNYRFPIQNLYNLNGLSTVFHSLSMRLPLADQTLISNELDFQAEHSTDLLPTGLIHADLFRDNVLCVDGNIAGLLDFYSACHGHLLFDLAITVNDWCCAGGLINLKKMTAVLSAYQSLRPLAPIEKRLWPIMLRRSALRFWLARLKYQSNARTGDLIKQKDPEEFRQILIKYQQLNPEVIL